MKGPFERLKYELRRTWECPECHHKERADGTVTTVLCRCQAKKKPLDQVVMTLIEDRILRRIPEFVVTTSDPEEPEVDSVPSTEDKTEPVDESS